MFYNKNLLSKSEAIYMNNLFTLLPGEGGGAPEFDP